MKKSIIIILLLTCYSNSFSQMNFGIRVGANLSDFTNLNTNKRTNFYGGIILPIQLKSKITLQPELNFSKQGAIYHLDANTDYNLYSDYLSNTVLFKYKVTAKTTVFGGPYVAVRLNKSVNRKSTSGYFFSYTSSTSLYKQPDEGIVLGIDYELVKNLMIELRYKHGLEDSIELRYFDSDFDGSLKEVTQVFQLGIAYKFKLKQTK